MLDNAISARPSVIAVAADGPAAIVPVLKKAKAAGCHVLTWDGDADYRKCFVNSVNYDAFGATLVEEMVKQVGKTADVAVVTSTLTAPWNCFGQWEFSKSNSRGHCVIHGRSENREDGSSQLGVIPALSTSAVMSALP
jgi:hypothetical protein